MTPPSGETTKTEQNEQELDMTMSKAHKSYADKIRKSLRHDPHAQRVAAGDPTVAHLIHGAVNLDHSLSRVIGKTDKDLFAHATAEQIIEVQEAATNLSQDRASAQEEARIGLNRPNTDQDEKPAHISKADSARKSADKQQRKMEQIITHSCDDPAAAFREVHGVMDALDKGRNPQVRLSAFLPNGRALTEAQASLMEGSQIGGKKDLAATTARQVGKLARGIHHYRRVEEAQNTSRAQGRALRTALQVVDGPFSAEHQGSRIDEIRRQADTALESRSIDAQAEKTRREQVRSSVEPKTYQPPQFEWSRGNGDLGLKRTGTDRER